MTFIKNNNILSESTFQSTFQEESKMDIIQELKKIAYFIFAILIYVNLGYGFNFLVSYVDYYPNSTAGKILVPFPYKFCQTKAFNNFIFKNGLPFQDEHGIVKQNDIPKIYTFAEYQNKAKDKVMLLWPILFLSYLAIIILEWLVLGGVHLWHAILFLWKWIVYLFSGKIFDNLL